MNNIAKELQYIYIRNAMREVFQGKDIQQYMAHCINEKLKLIRTFDDDHLKLHALRNLETAIDGMWDVFGLVDLAHKRALQDDVVKEENALLGIDEEGAA